MTVVNPKSISGINSITMASGSDDLLTIHSNNTTERVRVNNSGDVIIGSGVTLSPDGDGFFTGVITATSYSGIDLSDVTGATGDFSIADKIVPTGDTDTAIRFSAADTVSIETEGNEQIKFNHTTGTVLSNHIVPNNDGTKDIGLTGTRFRAAYVDTYYGDGSNLTGITGVTINSNTNNYLITGTGTANTLQGEANLQFDGTNIGVGVAPSGVASYSTIHLKGQTSGNGGAVRLTDYGDTPDSDDFTIYKNSAAGYLRINGTDPLIAYLNGADRVRIDSSGRVMIGTDTEGSTLADDFTVNTSSGNGGITIRTDNSSVGSLLFSDATSGTAEYAGFIQYDHSLSLIHISEPTRPY